MRTPIIVGMFGCICGATIFAIAASESRWVYASAMLVLTLLCAGSLVAYMRKSDRS